MTRKFQPLLILFLVLAFSAQGQGVQNLSVQADIGSQFYLGDLSYKLRFPDQDPAYRIGLGYQLSPAWAIAGSFQWGNLYGNDRLEANDELIRDNPDLTRSLNFMSKVRTVNFMAQYHFDNGKILKEGSLFAPYLFAGIGVTSFKVFADLYYGANNNLRYFYWSDNTVRDLPEGDFSGDVIEQDGEFETEVTNLGTGDGETYPTTVMQIPFGAGLKLRLSDHFSLNASVSFHYLFTDYIDDVSGGFPTQFDDPAVAYASNPANVNLTDRGNPNGNNDMFFMPAVGLIYRFGKADKIPGSETTARGSGVLMSDGQLDPFFATQKDKNRLAPIKELTQEEFATPVNYAGRDTVYILRTDTIIQAFNGKMIRADASTDEIRLFQNAAREAEFQEEMSQLKEEITQLRLLYEKAGENTDQAEIERLEREIAEISARRAIGSPLQPEVRKRTEGDKTAEERITEVRESLPPPRKGSEAAALQKLFEQLAFLNDEIEELKDKNDRFENMMVQAEDKKVSPMAPASSPDGGLGLIFSALKKETIYFGTSQHILTELQRERLSAIAPLLERYPNLGVIVTGHTDQAGNPSFNLLLSRKRAEAVREYFLSRPGIKEYQVMTNYFGPSLPSTEINGNSTRSQYDRRVEVDYLKVR